MTIHIDHATLCGSDLAVMRGGFAEAGLVTDYGGPHSAGGTHMALLGFEDGSYLELIAPLRPAHVEGSPWGSLMVSDAGPGAWAVGAANIQAEVARLKSFGIEAAEPQAGSRRRPDGKMIEWQTASAGPGAPGALLPFMIQDHTPREWRVQTSASMTGGRGSQEKGSQEHRSQEKRSHLSGIAMVMLGVNDIHSSVALFRQAYRWDEPLLEDHAEFGAQVAHFPGTPVMLATPLNRNSRLASRLAKFGEIPLTFLLRTDDIEQAAQRFRLTATENWFGHPVAWFEPGKPEPVTHDSAKLGTSKLHGVALGIIQS